MAVNSSALRKAAWNFVRILFLLLILSRVYALLIHLKWVPDYPDPILGFIGSTYSKLDQLLEGGSKSSKTSSTLPKAKKTLQEQLNELGLASLIIGNLVFGVLLRYYAPPPMPKTTPKPVATSTQELSKKQQKKQSSLLKEVEAEKSLATTPKAKLSKEEQAAKSAILKRNIIIVGRLTQCAIFLGKAVRGDEKHEQELLRHVVNAALSVGLTLAELAGIKWDGGLIGKLFVKKNEISKVVDAKKEVAEEDATLKLR